jgi:hypothetical protein
MMENIVVRTRSSLGGFSLTLTFLAFASSKRRCLDKALRIKHISLYSEGN